MTKNFNTFAYNTIGLLACAYLLICGTGVYAYHHLFIKAGMAFVAAAIIGLLISGKPTGMSWALVVVTFIISVYTIGLMGL